MDGQSSERSAALRNLVELRTPLRAAIAEVSLFPWDSDLELVFVTRLHLANVLDAYTRGDFSDFDLVDWAEALYGRDDVGFAFGDERLLNESLFELSNPTLVGPMKAIVSSIRGRLVL